MVSSGHGRERISIWILNSQHAYFGLWSGMRWAAVGSLFYIPSKFFPSGGGGTYMDYLGLWVQHGVGIRIAFYNIRCVNLILFYILTLFSIIISILYTILSSIQSSLCQNLRFESLSFILFLTTSILHLFFSLYFSFLLSFYFFFLHVLFKPWRNAPLHYRNTARKYAVFTQNKRYSNYGTF